MTAFEASAAVAPANAQAGHTLPFSDQRDLDNARRRFIAPREADSIHDTDGRPIPAHGTHLG